MGVQYSYLQSPLALILETRSGLDQARAMMGKVHDYWRKLPKDTRPRPYIHGLSLGAWSSMYGTNLFALLDDPINGALWAGPPFPSACGRALSLSAIKTARMYRQSWAMLALCVLPIMKLTLGGLRAGLMCGLLAYNIQTIRLFFMNQPRCSVHLYG